MANYFLGKNVGFSLFQRVSLSLTPCLSLNALVPTWAPK